MFEKQKKLKNPTNNINININLKVESKSNHLVGKKISNCKEINHTNKDLGRSNISTETFNKKKMSVKENHCKSKKSVEEFVNQHTISYENNQSDQQCVEKKPIQKPVLARNDFLKQGTQQDKKRMKSKSLQNLKIKYYQRSMEKSRQSHSKSKSKSIRKKKQQSPKSFIRSGKEVKSPEKNAAFSKSKSKSKSKSRSKSKSISISKSLSKSPIHISKKKSSQNLKIQDHLTSRDKQKDLSKEKRTERSKQKNKLAAKKYSHDIPRDKQKMITSNISKKYSAQVKNQFSKKISSNDKVRITKKNQGLKNAISHSLQQEKQKKRNPTKKKQNNNKFIYHKSYLKLVTKVQSHIKGYLARKQIQRELIQQSNRVLNFKNTNNWDLQSNNSIILIDNFSQNSNKSSINKVPENSNSQASNQNQPNGEFNPLILQQLQKLKRKIEEQEDRFKLLQKQNNELKANLSKINKQPNDQPKNQKCKPAEQIQKTNKLKPEIQQNQSPTYFFSKNRSPINELPVVIKTQESNNDLDYADMRKKMQMYQSPKNANMSFKFNKNVIKKLFLKEQQKLNKKLSLKNRQYEYILQEQIASPKTLHIRKEEIQKRIDQQKQEALIRFKEAQKALLLVAQLQQDNSNSVVGNESQYHKKQNQNNNSSFSSKNDSPKRKGLNLYINVDEIDSDTEKYHPIIVNHFHRQNQYQIEKEEDLSLLFTKAMSDKVQTKKCQEYLKQDLQVQYQQKGVEGQYNSPEIQEVRREEVNDNIKQQQQIQLQHPRKGFQTNLRYIRQFYIKFCQFFRKIPLFVDEIIENLTEQMTFDLQLFLKAYRVSIDFNDKTQLIFPYFKQLATYNLAIPVHILNSFYEEMTNPESPIFNKACLQLKESSKEQFENQGFSLYELKQYHDLALIDAFNEALNFERPGGPQASNTDYLTQNYHAIFKDRVRSKFYIQKEGSEKSQNFDSILGKSIGKVINEWAMNLCGFFNDSDDPEEQVELQKLEQIRHIRLTLMLQRGIIEQEGNVINMSSFKFYVKYDLQSSIFDMIIENFLQQIQKLQEKKKRRY